MLAGIQSALSGIHAHLDSFNQTASRIARSAPGPGADLPKDMVQMMIDKRCIQANASTIKVADDMIGTLVDILA